MINAALKTSYSIHYYEIFVKWEWNLLWYISDMTFKISFYSQACPKSWKGMTNKLLLCTGPFSRLLHISHSVWDFVFSSHRHTWAYTVQTPATICILHLPYLPPNQHNPTFLHFRQNNLSPPPQKKRIEVPPPCLSTSASHHSSEVGLSSQLEYAQYRWNAHTLKPAALL